MHMKHILFTSLTLCTAGAIAQAQVFINFVDTGARATPTISGNVFNEFGYDQDATNMVFDDIASTLLVDSTGAASAWSFTFAGNGVNEFSSTPNEADFDNKPATGFDWFDESVTELRNVGTVDDDPANKINYTFSGFSAADDITFQFVIARGSGSGTRTVDLDDVTNSVKILDDVETDITDSGISPQWITYTVSGSTSYSFEMYSSAGPNSAGAVINAMSIVPEPSTYALLGGLAALGLVLVRRRVRR